MEEHNPEVIKAHPLFFPVINGMIECALAGWSEPPQRNLIPYERTPANTPNRLDQFMLDALEAQWANKNELEYLHSSVTEFCKTAITNLDKTTSELLQCKPTELQGYGSTVKISTQTSMPLPHESQLVDCHGPPPPVPMSFVPPEPIVVPHKPPSILSSPTITRENQNHSPSSSLDKNMLSKNPKTLPKEATEVLKNWILVHWENPYPDEATKQQLVEETGLNRSQVVNWFINARRRLIKPMKPELEKQKVAKLTKRSRIPTIETYEEEEASDSDPDYEEPIAKKKKTNSSGKEGGSSDQVKNLISNWKHTTRKRPNDISDIPYCFSSVYLGSAGEFV